MTHSNEKSFLDASEYYLAFARHLVIEAGRTALKRFRHAKGWMKENDTIVTQTDIDIQTFLREEIERKFPSHSFLGEEREDYRPEPERIKEAEFTWVVDPIDGTDAFATGLPIWGVSLALLHLGEPIVGVFYLPVLGEMYHAIRGQEATLTLQPNRSNEENHPLHVFAGSRLTNRSLMLTASDFHRRWKSSWPGKQRSLGSVAAHLCVLARGDAVATVMRPAIWDIAAASLILRSAGGEFVDYETCEAIKEGDYLEETRLPLCLGLSTPAMFDIVKGHLKLLG